MKGPVVVLAVMKDPFLMLGVMKDPFVTLVLMKDPFITGVAGVGRWFRTQRAKFGHPVY